MVTPGAGVSVRLPATCRKHLHGDSPHLVPSTLHPTALHNTPENSPYCGYVCTSFKTCNFITENCEACRKLEVISSLATQKRALPHILAPNSHFQTEGDQSRPPRHRPLCKKDADPPGCSLKTGGDAPTRGRCPPWSRNEAALTTETGNAGRKSVQTNPSLVATPFTQTPLCGPLVTHSRLLCLKGMKAKKNKNKNK